MTRDQAIRNHVLHLTSYLLNVVKGGPLKDSFHDSYAHLPEVAKNWMAFFSLTEHNELRPSTLTAPHYWATCDFRCSRALHAINKKFSKCRFHYHSFSNLLLFIALLEINLPFSEALSSNILSQELSNPIYVTAMTSFSQAAQDVLQYDHEEPPSQESVGTAVSGRPENQLQATSSQQHYLVTQKPNQGYTVMMISALDDISTLAPVINLLNTSIPPASENPIAPNSSSTPVPTTSTTFAFPPLPVADPNQSFAMTASSVGPVLSQPSMPTSEAGTSMPPMSRNIASTPVRNELSMNLLPAIPEQEGSESSSNKAMPSSPTPAPTERKARNTRRSLLAKLNDDTSGTKSTKRPLTTSRSEKRLTRSQAKKQRPSTSSAQLASSQATSGQEHPSSASTSGDSEPPSDHEPDRPGDSSSSSEDDFQHGDVPARDPFKPPLPFRNTPARKRPAQQLIGVFNSNWNMPRNLYNPGNIPHGMNNIHFSY
ncbi:unnamed protein product [Oikopleura dioica]|uniref:Uncharacterized protein n=1 Tax=Oikopleura dioica TaxID=34765 RepID=E4YVP8_OIKDI|nr:unnamed protein product [Oikopleura dioica]